MFLEEKVLIEITLKVFILNKLKLFSDENMLPFIYTFIYTHA